MSAFLPSLGFPFEQASKPSPYRPGSFHAGFIAGAAVSVFCCVLVTLSLNFPGDWAWSRSMSPFKFLDEGPTRFGDVPEVRTRPLPVLSELLPPPWRSNSSSDAPYPNLCVLTRTYPGKYQYLPAFLATWTQMDMKALVLLLVTEPERQGQVLQAVVDTANAMGGEGRVRVLDVTEDQARTVFPGLGSITEYGYAYTDFALQVLKSNSSSYDCDYVVVTNGDNLYSSHFPKHVIPYMVQGLDLIGVSFVSGHTCPSCKKPPEADMGDTGDMVALTPVRFARGRIDLGCMVISLDFLRRTGLRFLDPSPEDISLADGLFAERAAPLTNKKIRLAETLFLHQ